MKDIAYEMDALFQISAGYCFLHYFLLHFWVIFNACVKKKVNFAFVAKILLFISATSWAFVFIFQCKKSW